MASSNTKFEVATVRRIARNYNAGLAQAQKVAREHNERVIEEFSAVGLVKCRQVRSSLMPIPFPCPETLGLHFVRKFMRAFDWKRAARNTGGQYLASRHAA